MLCLYTLGSVTSLDSAISVTTSQLALAVHSLSEGSRGKKQQSHFSRRICVSEVRPELLTFGRAVDEYFVSGEFWDNEL